MTTKDLMLFECDLCSEEYLDVPGELFHICDNCSDLALDIETEIE